MNRASLANLASALNDKRHMVVATFPIEKAAVDFAAKIEFVIIHIIP